MKCPKCGNDLVDSAKFCNKCGTRIPDTTAVNDDMNINAEENSAVDPSTNPQNVSKKNKSNFVWKEQYTYIVIAVAAVIAVGAGLIVRAAKPNAASEAAEYVAGIDGLKSNEKDDYKKTYSDMDETESVEETESPVEQDIEYVSQTETASEMGEAKKISTYQCVAKDISWCDAEREAETAGGHLAVITSEEEYNSVCKCAESSGLTYIWLGARLYSISDNWEDEGWITGEKWTYDRWYPNEPSRVDIGDNVEELYLCLWKAQYDGNDIGWTFNDQRNDIVADFPTVSGKIGYVIEFEE